jgi:putative sigma-54 modulation protein
MTLVTKPTQEEVAMQLDIRGRNLRLTPALLDHVDRRIRFALGRFATRLSRVAVRIGDVNGPRGGVDKRCWIHLELGGKTLTIEEIDADLYVAIDRASERAGRATERAIARLHAA